MGDSKDKAMDAAMAAVARQREKVAQEVEQHANEDVDLEDLEDVSGGWTITTYGTDPAPTPTPTPGGEELT
jgi:hypothetical protein